MRNKLILTTGLTFALLIPLLMSSGTANARNAQSKHESVEATRQRAVILSSVRVSYFGTPAGSIGRPFIPFERLFQDNATLFGLPTAVCAACVTYRSK
jgi:hypothetical protein